MLSPSPAMLKSLWKANYQHQVTTYLEEYVTKLFSEIETGWNTWQKSVKFGNFVVIGSGIGAWAGSGSGPGLATSGPFIIKPFPFYKTTPEHIKFIQSLSNALDARFRDWVKSFALTSMGYAGSSTASGESPGRFNANIVPVPVSTLSNPPLSGIKDEWEKELVLPDFNLSAPEGVTQDMTQAVATAVEKAFITMWAPATMLTGSRATGLALAGSGTGTGTSQVDGELV